MYASIKKLYNIMFNFSGRPSVYLSWRAFWQFWTARRTNT